MSDVFSRNAVLYQSRKLFLSYEWALFSISTIRLYRFHIIYYSRALVLTNILTLTNICDCSLLQRYLGNIGDWCNLSWLAISHYQVHASSIQGIKSITLSVAKS